MMTSPARAGSAQPTPISLLRAAGLLAVIAVLVIYRVDTVWSGSVDLAHHYALAFRIAENWQILPNDPTLGEMNFYPRLSHIAAATLGTLVNSTFLGIQLVSLLALALVWCAVLLIVGALANRAAVLASIALAVLVWANQKTLGLELHGAELVGNYFFAQLVGQALALITVAGALHIEKSRGREYARGLIFLSIYVITSVHLLPALELFGMFCGLLLVDILTTAGTGPARLRSATIAAVWVCASAASVWFNPAFAAMRTISENNGWLHIHLLGTRAALIALCMVVAGGALLMLRYWYRHRERDGFAPFKYLAVYGGAMALLCLLQICLLSLNLGSDYATKKYAFGLMTVLFVYIAVAFGVAGEKVLRKATLGAIWSDSGAKFLLLLVMLAAIFIASTARPKVLDTSDMVALEHQLLTTRDSALSVPPKGKSDVIIDLKAQPPMVNYMFSIAITHTLRDIAIPDVLTANNLADYDRYNHILTSREGSRFGKANCPSNASGPLLVLDSACVKKAAQQARNCSGIFDFSVNGHIDPSMLSGFSDAEATSRWTERHRATFTCTAVEGMSTARISVTPFLYGTHQRQRLSLSVNGMAAVALDFHSGDTGRDIELPLPKFAPGANWVFVLDIPDAISPKMMGLSADGRELGFSVTTLSIQ